MHDEYEKVCKFYDIMPLSAANVDTNSVAIVRVDFNVPLASESTKLSDASLPFVVESAQEEVRHIELQSEKKEIYLEQQSAEMQMSPLFVDDAENTASSACLAMQHEKQSKVIADTSRIDSSIDTITFLLERGASVIIVTHFGRPALNKSSDEQSEYSVRFLLDYLSQKLRRKVEFIGAKSGLERDLAKDMLLRVEDILKTSNAKVFLMENIRFFAQETMCNKDVVGDIISAELQTGDERLKDKRLKGGRFEKGNDVLNIGITEALEEHGVDATDIDASCQDKQHVSLQNANQDLMSSEKFSEKICSFANIYVNDAFSCSHRKHMSIVQFPEYLASYAGFSLLRELAALHDIALKNDEKGAQCVVDSCIAKGEGNAMHADANNGLLRGQSNSDCEVRGGGFAVISGAKVETKLPLLRNVAKKMRNIALGGIIANTFMKAAGQEIGLSRYDDNMVSEAKKLLQEGRFILPIDYVCFDEQTNMVNIRKDVKQNEVICDIGPETVELFSKVAYDSDLLVWCGPLGKYEDERFRFGTLNFADSIRNAKHLRKIAGGGDTLAALRDIDCECFDHCSMAGGAFVDWLSFNSLPGLDALKITKIERDDAK